MFLRLDLCMDSRAASCTLWLEGCRMLNLRAIIRVPYGALVRVNAAVTVFSIYGSGRVVGQASVT